MWHGHSCQAFLPVWFSPAWGRRSVFVCIFSIIRGRNAKGSKNGLRWAFSANSLSVRKISLDIAREFVYRICGCTPALLHRRWCSDPDSVKGGPAPAASLTAVLSSHPAAGRHGRGRQSHERSSVHPKYEIHKEPRRPLCRRPARGHCCTASSAREAARFTSKCHFHVS